MISKTTYLNGVASWARPCIAPALPAILSTNMPIVIRLGNAWGLMMTSGCMPLSVKGISTAGHFCEQTPFCPCRDENLSPMTGARGMRNVIWIFCSSVPPRSLLPVTRLHQKAVFWVITSPYTHPAIELRRHKPSRLPCIGQTLSDQLYHQYKLQ